MNSVIEFVGNGFIVLIGIILLLCVMGIGVLLLIWIFTKVFKSLFDNWEE